MALRIIRDNVDPNTIADVAAAVSPRIYGTHMIKHNDAFTYPLTDVLNFEEGFGVPIYDGESWRQCLNTDAFTATASSLLDTGTFQIGTDYYIYLCLPGTTGQPIIMISANSTWPLGQTADSCRKIGGFHYGVVRRVSSRWIPIDSTGVEFGSNGIAWGQNVDVGIIPNSIWDLKNKAKVQLPGMVKVGQRWFTKYICSQDEVVTKGALDSLDHIIAGTLKSSYGAIPVTGTEGLSGFHFIELANRMGMELPSYQEFLMFAFGNPQGQDSSDDYGWTKTTNTGRQRTGASVDPTTGLYSLSGVKKYAVSAFNLDDCVGNVLEWCRDFYQRAGTEQNAATAWGWQNQLGANKGQAYTFGANGIGQIRVGGDWRVGVDAGCRTVALNYYPWSVDANTGCRLASDAL